MKCFNHSTVEAVGVCRSCGRCLCHGCIQEVGLSCSCRNRCESVVATMNDLVVRGRTAYQKSSTLQLRNGIFISLLAIIFISLSVFRFVQGDASEWTYFFLAAGVLFGGLGVVALIAAKRFREK
jgi:hypothetical protein